MNFSMNYYLNVSLIRSSTKNDRCQDVTTGIGSFYAKNLFFKDLGVTHARHYINLKIIMERNFDKDLMVMSQKTLTPFSFRFL